MHLIKSSLEMKWIMNRSEMAKSFNGNQEGKKRMRVIFSSFLNRMKRMNSTPIQPICNKEEALKRYRTVFWSVWNKESIYQLLLIHSSHRDTSSCISKPFHLFISLLYHLDSWSCHFSKWINAIEKYNLVLNEIDCCSSVHQLVLNSNQFQFILFWLS